MQKSVIGGMSQSAITEKLIAIGNAYTGAALIFTVPPALAKSERMLMNDTLLKITKHTSAQFNHDPPSSAGSIMKRRPDLANSLWSDFHRVMRGSGKPFLNEVNKAVSANPENKDLAITAKVANDMYAAINRVYQADKKVEGDFKRKARANAPESGHTPVEEARMQWKDERSEALAQDEQVQEAHAIINDVMLPVLDNDEEQKAEKRATLIADYSEEFPEAIDEQLLDAVLLGEKIAVYSFVATHGLFALSDKKLENVLSASSEFGEEAARDVAQLTDILREAPYHVPIKTDEAEIKKNMTGHSRQAKIYSVCEALLGGERQILDAAVSSLAAVGIDETAEVRTGAEMAVLIGSVAGRQENEIWLEAAGKLLDAQTREELQGVLSCEETKAALDDIAGIDAGRNNALNMAQALLRDARSRADELDVKLPSAARQYMAQAAATRQTGGCPMHR